MHIFVTGGAGYVGSLLVPLLIDQEHKVTVLDNFAYNQIGLMDVVHSPNFHLIRGDVRDAKGVALAAQGADVIVHLAGVVGAPACYADLERSHAINVTGTENVVRAAEGRLILFPSTGSCYGHVPSGLCTEETPISPLTAYGAQKAEAEAIVRESTGPWVIFRFATVFGASLRPRLDLLINDFAYRAIVDRSLVVYEPEYRRTFIHVWDAARVFAWAISLWEQRDVSWESFRNKIYNVGHPDMNLTKLEVAQRIVARVPGCIFNPTGEGKDPDARNYAVDYSRITDAGFECEVGFEEGLDEVFKMCKILKHPLPYRNAG